MSTTLHVALEPELNGVDITRDRVFLARLVGDAEELDRVCKSLGVPLLTGFVSYDPVELARSFVEMGFGTAPPSNIPPAKWFSPTDGLQTVRALHTHYSRARYVQERGVRRRVAGKVQFEPLDRTNDLLGELSDLEEVLVQATTARSQFRLYMF